MPLPNFLVIGAQKAGTTWLLRHLSQHPDIYMPAEEVHFFDKKYNYAKGLSWYRQFFEKATTERAIGEKTPDYFWTNQPGAEGHLPSVHRNIHDAVPEAKLILIVRDPVDRAVSAVNHLLRTRRVSPRYSIDDLLAGESRHLVEPHGVLDYGLYYKHIQSYLDLFDPDQFLILVFEEDIVANPRAGLRTVTEFLGVDPSFRFTGVQERENPPAVSKPGLYLRYYVPFLTPFVRLFDRHLLGSHYKQRPTDDTIHTLYDFYRDENEKLYRFLGRRIPSWSRSHH
ncbi:MAG: sulfotransferase domain-containing protein [Salinivenus sp.]